ncbi:MAG: hypothetical protein ACNA71_05640 [Kiritimatiellia bacterium]
MMRVSHNWRLRIMIWLGPAVAMAASTQSPFMHAIDTAPLQQEEIVAVSISPFIWDTATDQPVMYIYNDKDQTVPYLLRQATTSRIRSVRDRVGSSIENLQAHADERIELDIAVHKDAPAPHIVEIVTPLQNFVREVTIVGIAADGAETTLVEDAIIYDYTRFADVRSNTIALPENTTDRRFRLLIRNPKDAHPVLERVIQRTLVENTEQSRTEQFTTTERFFRIDAVNLYAIREVETQSKAREIPIAIKKWSVAEDPRRQQTMIEIETYNTPLHGISIATDDANFARHASISYPRKDAGRASWQRIGHTELARIRFRNITSEQLRISFPQRQEHRLKLVLENHDTPPLTITNVVGVGPDWQVLFLAQPQQQYLLYHGAQATQAPRYNTAPILRLLERGIQPREITLGEANANPDYAVTSFWLPTIMRPRAAFILGIILMTAALAWGLYRAARGIPQEQAS